MKALAKRLLALEGLGGAIHGRPPFWLRIVGRTESEARAAYEAEHGPIEPGAGIVFRRIVEPRQ